MNGRHIMFFPVASIVCFGSIYFLSNNWFSVRKISFAFCQSYSVLLTVWAICINQYTWSDFINSPYGYKLTQVCYSILLITSEEASIWLTYSVQPERRTKPLEPAQSVLLSIARAFQSALPWALNTVLPCQAAQQKCPYIFHFLLSLPGLR